MNHEQCRTCEHKLTPGNHSECSGLPIDNDGPLCHWEPDAESRSLIAFGRRAGIEEALQACRSTSPQEDPEVYIEALLEAK